MTRWESWRPNLRGWKERLREQPLEVMRTSCRPVWLQGLFLQAPGHQQRRSGEPWIRSPSNFPQAPEHFRGARRWIREARCLPTCRGLHSPEGLANRRCLGLFSRWVWTVAIETQKHPTPASAISWRVCVGCRARAGGAREGKGAGAGSSPSSIPWVVGRCPCEVQPGRVAPGGD